MDQLTGQDFYDKAALSIFKDWGIDPDGPVEDDCINPIYRFPPKFTPQFFSSIHFVQGTSMVGRCMLETRELQKMPHCSTGFPRNHSNKSSAETGHQRGGELRPQLAEPPRGDHQLPALPYWQVEEVLWRGRCPLGGLRHHVSSGKQYNNTQCQDEGRILSHCVIKILMACTCRIVRNLFAHAQYQ